MYDLKVEAHENKTFDHFIVLDSDETLQSRRYQSIADTLHKEVPIDANWSSESMNWLLFLLPNLIQQHQKCIRLMELGTLEL